MRSTLSDVASDICLSLRQSLIKFNVSARKAAQTGNATRNKLAQEALELEKA